MADFFIVTVTAKDNIPYGLHIFPDGTNEQLVNAGLPTHYYYIPQRLVIARRPDNEEDFDFGCYTFQGVNMGQDNITGGDPPTGDDRFLGGYWDFHNDLRYS